MTLPAEYLATPRLPLDEDGGPVFSAPWEARIFAMTVKAHEAGVFTWGEWAEALGAELAKDGDGSGETESYYDRWLAAFETLLTAKNVAAAGQLADLRKAWDKAAKATPHGKPIVLENA
ncbi:nitrile hydratase accessory protein [Roseibium aggregatum]|uniref:nitrile hydratase accessory protein n=1 Tax=Roseibium aggregatum TaxID=187304 RepID=UPI000301E1B3|nr:nitrile hydratase accessory protein [Roseibium aggregatum]